MRALKAIPLALALCACAAPAAARPAPKKPPAAGEAKGKHDKKAGDKETRAIEAMKREGIDETRAKQVVAVMKKYRGERQPVRKEVQTHRETLRELLARDSADQAAYEKALDGLKAARKKLQALQERQVEEIQRILKPSEQAKVLRLLFRARSLGVGAGGD